MLLIGIGLGVCLNYNLGDQIRVQGIPIPLVTFVHEGELWTDFVKPPWLTLLCVISNCLFPVGLGSLIWLLAAGAATPRVASRQFQENE